MVMAVRFLASLLLASVLLAVAQQRDAATAAAAAPSVAEEFWGTVLPDYPLPDALLWYLQPAEGTSAGDDTSSSDHTADIAQRLSRQWPYYYSTYSNKRPASPHKPPITDDITEQLSRNWPFYYSIYTNKRPSSHNRPPTTDETAERLSRQWTFYIFSIYSNKRPSSHNRPPTTDETAERLSRQWPYYYSTYRNRNKLSPSLHKPAATRSSSDDENGHYSHVMAGGDADRAKMNNSAVFFHEDAVQVGRTLPFYFPPARRAPLGMLPRSAADSIPFSMGALPDILAWLGVAASSPQAADMETTLSMCEAPSPVEEPKFCATSLEALLEGVMATLGGRGGIRPVTSILPRSGAPWQPYAIRAVRRLMEDRFVSCHDVVYPYTVYRCHDTGPARLYMVEMEGARGGGVVDVAVVCHTDTSQWDPEHLSFKLLGTKPGGAPVCHVMPYGHIVWARNGGGDDSSS